MFAFVKGVYAGEGDDGCVVPAGSIHVGNVEGAGGQEMGGHSVSICHRCVLLLFPATFLIRSSRHSPLRPGPLKPSPLDNFYPDTK